MAAAHLAPPQHMGKKKSLAIAVEHMKETTKRYKNWKELALDWSEATTIHGVKEFTRPDNPNLKLGWGLLIVACIAGMSYCVHQILNQYWSSPTASSVLHIRPTYFPTVLFCPRDWINHTRAEQEYGIDSDVIKFLKLTSYYNFDWFGSYMDIDYNLTDVRAKVRNISNEHNLKTMHQIWSAIAKDASIITKYAPSVELSIESVTPFVRSYSVCYRIQFQQSNFTMRNFLERRTFVYSLPANTSGLLAEPEGSFYNPDRATRALQPTENYHSIIIGPDANSRYSENSYPIKKDQSFVFQIKVTEHQYPTGKIGTVCDPNPVNNDNPDSPGQLECIVDCYEIYAEQLYSCPFFFGKEEDMFSYCLFQDKYQSIDDILQIKRDSNQSQETLENCFNKCTLPCTQWTYEPTILGIGTYSPYSETPPDTQTGAVQFQFRDYFSSIQIVEASTYSWYSFLGNIGGMVSLWTGASFVSACHIVYHFLLRQICPRPQTVTELRRVASERMKDGLRRVSSTETLQRLSIKKPFWVRTKDNAKEAIRKMSTSHGRVFPDIPKPMRRFRFGDNAGTSDANSDDFEAENDNEQQPEGKRKLSKSNSLPAKIADQIYFVDMPASENQMQYQSEESESESDTDKDVRTGKASALNPIHEDVEARSSGLSFDASRLGSTSAVNTPSPYLHSNGSEPPADPTNSRNHLRNEVFLFPPPSPSSEPPSLDGLDESEV